MRAMGPHHMLLVVVLSFTTLQSALAQACPVGYRTVGNARPMLFGGLYDGTCTSGCKDRNSNWGQICAFNPARNDHWGVCTSEQRNRGRDAIFNFDRGALGLQPCQLHNFMKGRTLWIIGDSYGQDLFKAIQCFLIDFWGNTECQLGSDPSALAPILRLPVQPGRAKCIHLLGNGRMCMVRTVLGTQLVANPRFPSGGVLPYIQQRFARPQDVFLVNFAIWHRKEGAAGMASYGASLRALGQYYQRTRGRFPHLFFRETPADHPKDMARNVCLPFGGLVYQRASGTVTTMAAARVGAAATSVAAGAPFNRLARTIAGQVGLPLFGGRSWALSTTLYHQHIGMRNVKALDCLHYCQPGLPQLWVWELHQLMSRGTTGIRAQSVSNARAMLPCVPSTGF